MKPLALIMFLLSAVCALSSCATPPAMASGVSDYIGAWAVALCDGRQDGQPCGTFDLYLTQDAQGRICGQHFVATPGLGRLDESDPSTVLGIVEQDTAVVVIRSTRNDARYMARLSMRDGRLRWHRIGLVVPGADDEPPVIPDSATLERSAQDEKHRYLASMVESGCRWPDWGE